MRASSEPESAGVAGIIPEKLHPALHRCHACPAGSTSGGPRIDRMP